MILDVPIEFKLWLEGREKMGALQGSAVAAVVAAGAAATPQRNSGAHRSLRFLRAQPDAAGAMPDRLSVSLSIWPPPILAPRAGAH